MKTFHVTLGNLYRIEGTPEVFEVTVKETLRNGDILLVIVYLANGETRAKRQANGTYNGALWLNYAPNQETAFERV